MPKPAQPEPRSSSRRSNAQPSLVAGAIAGFVATAAMTTVMRQLHRRLPQQQRYPLPPRELAEKVFPYMKPEQLSDITLAAHFGYGAGAGAVLAAVKPGAGVVSGAVYGLSVWGLSYLGWIPLARLLKPATRHPSGRNLLMMAAHLAWGSVTAITLRELAASRATVFAEGPLKDARPLPAKTAHDRRQREPRRPEAGRGETS